MNSPIAEKTVNALIADAEMGFGARFLVNNTGLGVTETVLKGFKKAMGGLWVGGTATLYETRIAFRPNVRLEVLAETRTYPLMGLSR